MKFPNLEEIILLTISWSVSGNPVICYPSDMLVYKVHHALQR